MTTKSQNYYTLATVTSANIFNFTMAKLRRPPLTDKTMSGLIELVSIVDSGDPISLLGDDPRAWEGTQQGTELKNRWEAIESACKWINQLQKYKSKKRP